jgi:hypothetical protein
MASETFAGSTGRPRSSSTRSWTDRLLIRWGPWTSTEASKGRSLTAMTRVAPVGPTTSQVMSTSSKSPVANRSRIARWIDGKFSVVPVTIPEEATMASRETRTCPRTSSESGVRQRPVMPDWSCAARGAATTRAASARLGSRSILGIYTVGAGRFSPAPVAAGRVYARLRPWGSWPGPGTRAWCRPLRRPP